MLDKNKSSTIVDLDLWRVSAPEHFIVQQILPSLYARKPSYFRPYFNKLNTCSLLLALPQENLPALDLRTYASSIMGQHPRQQVLLLVSLSHSVTRLVSYIQSCHSTSCHVSLLEYWSVKARKVRLVFIALEIFTETARLRITTKKMWL